MAVSSEYLAYIIERLQCVGQVVSKRMFGGVGLYFEAKFFGLIADNILYFKTDESTISEYRDAGMEPFRPYGNESYAMKYYTVPEEVIESDELLTLWSSKSITIAGKAKKSKTKSPKIGARKKR